MLQFPMATMLRFCDNHGLLQIANRPQWYTVQGGARRYIDAIVQTLDDVRLNAPVSTIERKDSEVLVTAQGRTEPFDYVVAACHPDQTLAALEDASAAERAVLGAITYQANEAILHTDASLLPKRARTWAAWNYEHSGNAEKSQVCLHYLINKLQPVPFQQPVIVSLNPVREPHPTTIIKRIAYSHPVFDRAAIAAQQQLASIQGTGNVWFGGAWAGYGFHEDGLAAGQQAAQQILQKINL
jgi:uncharacterized protein